MHQTKKWLTNYYPLLIILFISAAFRICLLLMRGTLWFDEIFSVHFSSLPWHEALKYWILETNPPLHTLFLRGFIFLFGDNDYLVRIPSIIFGLTTIAIIYWFAQKTISKKAAIISSAIMSFSGIMIYSNTEARVYSLLMLLTCVSFYFFYLIFVEKRESKMIWWLYGLTQFLLLYAHLTAFTIIIIQFISYLFYQDKNKQTAKKFFSVQIISFLLWCFWLIPSLLSKLNPDTLNGWFFTYDRQKENILTTFTSLFVNVILSDFTFTLFSLILFSLALIIFWQLKQKPAKENCWLITLILWGVVPGVLGAFLGQYMTKYFLFSLPALALLTAYSIEKIKEKIVQLALIICIFALMIPSAFTIATNPIFSWYSLTKLIEKEETKQSVIFSIPFNEELSLHRYYRGNSPIYGVYPKVDNLSLDERIVRYNWMTVFSGNYDNWISQRITGKDRVFFLQYDGSNNEQIMWFVNRGWTIKNKIKAVGHIGIHLFELDGPTTTAKNLMIK